MPFLSIIIPVYKTEAYLEKCINSIISQSFLDYELILVDDGSPDGCPKICDDFAKKYDFIKVIHKKNGGVSSARNEGIKLANGKYIWFIDSDDYVFRNSLKDISESLQKNKPDLLVFNTKTNDCFLGDFNQFLDKHYFTYNLGFAPWNKIYKRDIIEKCNLFFDTEETIGEDLLFNFAYYNKLFINCGQVLITNANYYCYIDRESSAMNTKQKDRLIKQLRLYKKIRKNYSENISKENKYYLFLLHLISGIGQSANGNLTAKEFSEIDFSDFRKELYSSNKVKNKFFKNEKSTLLGKMRINVFIFLMKLNCQYISGKVMGLK